MDTEAAAAFWSYAHADNDSDNGRIVRLAHDLQKEYRLLTGGELTLFLDRDSIQWGENLRERIDEALADTTFLIPVITPTFFKSDECRRELIAFSQEAKRLSVEALLLPVYYVTVPEFSAEDGTDELVRLVKDTKYENWTKLRLEDVESSAYRKGVHGLARCLANVVRDLTTTPPNAPSNGGGAPVGDSSTTTTEDEEPGLVDRLAEGEDAMPMLAQVVTDLGPAIDELSAAVQQAAKEIQDNNARRGGAKGVLRIMTRLAETLKAPAQKILDLGQRNTATLLKVDPAVNAMIGQIEADPKEAEKVEGVSDYIKGIRMIASGGRAATSSLSELSSSTEGVAGAARVLRPVVRDIQSGLRGFVDAQAIYDEWERRLDAIDGLPDATE
jgi:hypothetical protein